MKSPERLTIKVDGNSIAVRFRRGDNPGLVWLGGFRSDMIGTKAEAIDGWAEKAGRSFLRHDYSGHGESGGDYRNGTISRWLAESLAVFRHYAKGPQILIGSSMGGWIALRMIEELRRAGEGKNVAGLLLLAPAPDFTVELVETALTEAERSDLEHKGFFEEPSAYSDQPNVFTREMIEDGRKNRVLDGLIDTHCPVHIIQGQADPDVPSWLALKLAEHLPADDVVLTLVKDGDHRLSRPEDIELLLRTIEKISSTVS